MIKLEDMTYGDRWPFPYFRLWEWKFSGGQFSKVEMSLASDFSVLKFSTRHEDNREDINDHSKDNIYSDMTSDGDGLCHYQWGANDTNKVGKFIGRLTGTRSDGRLWHSKTWFYYYVTPKSRVGTESI